MNHFDTAQYGVEDPEAVEFNAVSGTLFILSTGSTPSRRSVIVETTTSGTLVQTIDASASAPSSLPDSRTRLRAMEAV